VRTWWPRQAAGFSFLLGLALTGVAVVWQIDHNDAVARAEFESISRRAKRQLVERLGTYEFGLRGLRGSVLAVGPDAFGRTAFEAYSRTRDIDREFPGARGIGWIRRVAVQDEARFVAAARADGAADFALRQLTPRRGERWVIQYVDPLERNRAAVGLDVASEDHRRAAADAAMRSGQATLSAPIAIVQAGGAGRRSFLLLLPVYRGGAVPADEAGREREAVGWTYAPLVIDEVLADFDLRDGEITLALRDTTSGTPVEFFASQGGQAAPAAGLADRTAVNIYGRRWLAEVQATPRLLARLQQTDPRAIAAGGVLLSALMAMLAWLWARNAQRAQQVQLERARRAALVANSSDAIVGTTLDGVITDWNAGAQRLLGHAAAEVVGRQIGSWLVPDDHAAECAATRAAAASGQVLAPVDTVRLHRDGNPVEVSLAASPIVEPDGSVTGLAMTLRDISAAKRAEREVHELNARLEQLVDERTALLDAARRDLRNILDAVPSVIGYWDGALRNRFANRAYEDFFGVPAESLPGRHVRDVLGEAGFERARPHIEAALRGEAQIFERSLPRPDGPGERHTLTHYLPDMVDGQARGFYAIVHDITRQVDDQRRLAAALRENEMLLRTIRLHTICSVADRAGRIVDVNDGFCTISGYTRDELIGQDHRIVNSGQHDPSFWRAMWRTVAAGQPWRGEVCNRAKDGSLYWVNSIIAPFIGDSGQIERYISIRTDITAAKLAEQQLRASEAFLDRAGRLAGVGGWTYELDPPTITWSAQTCRIHEVEPGFVPPLDRAIAFYAPTARATIEAAVRRAIEDGTPWDLELPMVTAKGRPIWVRTVGAVESEQGRTVRLTGAVQDITARKQAELALDLERERMNSLMSTLPDQIYFKDRASRFLRINPGLARRYGLADPAQAIGRSDADFFMPEHAARTADVERQILDSGEPIINLEEQEFWPDRPPTWNLTTKMPLRDSSGAIVGTFGISRDITERKRIEEQLQQVNARFSIAAGAAGIGVWDWDVTSGQLVWDDGMYRLYRREPVPETETFALWLRCVHPEDVRRCEEALARALDGRGDYDPEFRIVRPDGEIRHVKAGARVLRGDDGGALRITGVNIDITERKRAEIDLLATSSLLRTVLDSASEVSIIATRPDMQITVFNRGAERMLGWRAAEMVGHGTVRLIHFAPEIAARKAVLAARLGRPVRSGEVFTDPSLIGQALEWTYVARDGRHVPVSLVVTAMHAPDGELLGYLGIAHDISLQRSVEASLREAKTKAEQASQAKSQFLANMSHEIRTPLNAVIGLTHLLSQTALAPAQDACLEKIRIASRSLLAVINDILDLSKIEASELLIETVPFDPHALVEDLCSLMAMQADEKGVEFVVDWDEGLPEALEGDPVRVRQILLNLLSNALKFTERGRVVLRVKVIVQDAQRVRCLFEVEDTGIGIEPEVQAQLFAPFAQADASTTRRFGGTGLGLSIVKRLTSLMDGEVSLRSTPGQGSVFSVELPFLVGEAAAIHRDATTEDPPRRLDGARILVVDDSDVNREVARGILQRAGAEVVTAENGLEAVQAVGRQVPGFDLVLMDVQMPVLDGYAATRRLRETLAGTELPIVALTAGALSSERQRALDAGMDDFVGKPFEPRDLIRIIGRYVRSKPGPGGDAPEPAAQSGLAWPAIPGIDGAEVCTRLDGDVALFASMLRRLIEEFPAGHPADTADNSIADWRERSGYFHKLRGAAGTLGAKRIARLAGDAELACRGGDVPQLELTLPVLSEELAGLRRSSVDFLAAARGRHTAGDGAAAPPADAASIGLLLALLRSQSLEASDVLAGLMPALCALVGDETTRRIEAYVEELRFSEAAELIEQGAASSANDQSTEP
jgi:PAS domain S-box-containing protein